jgi:hypothetical protein
MSPQEYYPQRGVVGRHEETFNDVLYAQLRKTPWWLISGAIHLVLIIGLWNFTFSASNTEEEGSIMANQSAEDFDDLKEEPPPVEEIPPIEQEEEPIEDPTIKDTPVEQEDTDEEFEETQTDQDLLSDAPFDGPSTNSTIGIGGGARRRVRRPWRTAESPGRGWRRHAGRGGPRARVAEEPPVPRGLLGLRQLHEQQRDGRQLGGRPGLRALRSGHLRPGAPGLPGRR